jgi:hypothetical protein
MIKIHDILLVIGINMCATIAPKYIYDIGWLKDETNGLGGICRFCNLPVNMFTTFVIDGRFLGFH